MRSVWHDLVLGLLPRTKSLLPNPGPNPKWAPVVRLCDVCVMIWCGAFFPGRKVSCETLGHPKFLAPEVCVAWERTWNTCGTQQEHPDVCGGAFQSTEHGTRVEHMRNTCGLPQYKPGETLLLSTSGTHVEHTTEDCSSRAKMMHRSWNTLEHKRNTCAHSGFTQTKRAKHRFGAQMEHMWNT
jgi:hypothetical protein